MKKVIGWVLLGVLVFYIGTNPGPAADTFRGIGDGFVNIFGNIATFFTQLFRH
jgi:hypothetical protein